MCWKCHSAIGARRKKRQNAAENPEDDGTGESEIDWPYIYGILAAEFGYKQNEAKKQLCYNDLLALLRYRKDNPPIGVAVQLLKAYFGIKDNETISNNKPSSYNDFLAECSAAGVPVNKLS